MNEFLTMVLLTPKERASPEDINALFSDCVFLMLTYSESSCSISTPVPFKAQGPQSDVGLKSTLYNGIFKSRIIYMWREIKEVATFQTGHSSKEVQEASQKLLFYGSITSDAWAFQVALMVKNLPTNAVDIREAGSVPGLGRCPGGRHGNPLQYSCLENPMDRGAWWARVMRSKRVGHNWSNWACTHAQVMLMTINHTSDLVF